MSLPDPGGLALPDAGARVRLVGQLPTTVAVLVVLAVLFSGAPGAAPNWSTLVGVVTNLSVEDIAWISVGILVLTLLLIPLQRGAVRLLEGYPLLTGAGVLFGTPLLWLWRRRYDRWNAAQQRQRPSDKQKVGMVRAAARLRQLPERHRLLPTRLGNVLRAAEDAGKARYGLDTVTIWPMLYAVLPDRLSAGLEDARNQLDLAARFCCSLALAAVISGALLIGSWWAVPVAGGLLLLAALSYRGSVAAAGAYGALINAAVDLHRFDLLRALHLPLPVNPPAELVANRALMQFLRHRVPMSDMDYQHPSV